MNATFVLIVRIALVLGLEFYWYVGYFLGPRFITCEPKIQIDWFVSGPCGFGATLGYLFGLGTLSQFIVYVAGAVIIFLVVWYGERFYTKKLWR